MAEPRIVKKYPNRRLYDTQLSRYITLTDIRNLVMEAVDFRVIDTNTKEDLTRGILLQIILEQEAGQQPLFTTEILAHMIRFYGDTIQGLFTRYMEQSLALFAEQQKRMQEQMDDTVPIDPIEIMAELTQRNLEMWKDLQSSFYKAMGFKPNASSHSD